MDFKMRYVAIALLVIFVVMGVLNSATGQIAEAAGVPEDQIQSGLDIAMIGFNMMQEEDPRAAMVFLLTFLLVPVGIMYALIYGILDEVGHNYLSEKVIQPLSVLLAMTTLFSGAFVALSAAIGAFGLYLVGGAGAIALYFIADEWYVQSSHRHKEKTAEMGMTEHEAELQSEVSEREEELRNERSKLLNELKKANNPSQKTFQSGRNPDVSRKQMKKVGMAEWFKSFKGTPTLKDLCIQLTDQEAGDVDNIKGLASAILDAQKDVAWSGTNGSTIMNHVEKMRDLAEEIEDLENRELKEVEKDLHK